MLCDFMVFGVPQNCPECNGYVVFRFFVVFKFWCFAIFFYILSASIHAYKCKGFLSEYTPCPFTSKNPARYFLEKIPNFLIDEIVYFSVPFKVPKELRKEHDFLKDYNKTTVFLSF